MLGRILTGIAVLLLAACGGGGGGGGGGSGIDPRLARLDVYGAQKLRVLGDPAIGVPALPATADENIPLSGFATFEGSATIRIEVPSDPLVLFGDATVRLDFDAGATSGTLDNFFGQTAGGQIADYDGEIVLNGGTPGAQFDLSYAGTLTASGQGLVFDGTLDAQMLGEDMTAIAASDLEASVTQGGTPRDATLVLIGEVIP